MKNGRINILSYSNDKIKFDVAVSELRKTTSGDFLEEKNPLLSPKAGSITS